MEEQQSLEERFASLDQIVERMESGETSLEETFALYRQGMEELKACDETISRVEEAVMEIQADGSLRVFSGGENEVEE